MFRKSLGASRRKALFSDRYEGSVLDRDFDRDPYDKPITAENLNLTKSHRPLAEA